MGTPDARERERREREREREQESSKRAAIENYNSTIVTLTEFIK